MGYSLLNILISNILNLSQLFNLRGRYYEVYQIMYFVVETENFENYKSQNYLIKFFFPV